MPHYRAYPLDNAGHFIGATDFEAADDNDAIQAVKTFPQKGSYELWCGGRFVDHVIRDGNVIGLARPTDRSLTG